MEPKQGDLQLPFPELGGDQPLIPVRMLNEHVYCPRLAYLEWVQGEWADSADTVDGRHRHQRVDKPSGDLPAVDKAREENTEIHARSVTLSSNTIGLIAKLDLIEGEGDTVTPVDYKRGKRPHTPRGVYDPERVQLCAQGLLLREHGYVCDEGAIYYVASKERVSVPFDDELLALTRNAIAELRAMAAGGRIYLSASGLDSELGQEYSGAGMAVERRYTPLSEVMRAKHAIHGAVCLYRQHELGEMIRSAGLVVEKLFASPFGNIKAVAKRG